VEIFFLYQKLSAPRSAVQFAVPLATAVWLTGLPPPPFVCDIISTSALRFLCKIFALPSPPFAPVSRLFFLLTYSPSRYDPRSFMFWTASLCPCSQLRGITDQSAPLPNFPQPRDSRSVGASNEAFLRMPVILCRLLSSFFHFRNISVRYPPIDLPLLEVSHFFDQ